MRIQVENKNPRVFPDFQREKKKSLSFACSPHFPGWQTPCLINFNKKIISKIQILGRLYFLELQTHETRNLMDMNKLQIYIRFSQTMQALHSSITRTEFNHNSSTLRLENFDSRSRSVEEYERKFTDETTYQQNL